MRLSRFSTAVLAGVVLTGCSDLSKLAGVPPLPSGVQDPTAYQNAAGAVAMYRGARLAFQGEPKAVGAFPQAITAEGLITDELRDVAIDCSAGPCVVRGGGGVTAEDARRLPEVASGTGSGVTPYMALQHTRATAAQAIGMLAEYAPDSVDLRAEVYVIAGYAELYLADLYCSGVPLSTVDYHGDYTYQAGSTTDQVYAHADSLFTQALALVQDSVRVRHWAAVGRGRALLARGQVDAAAQAVHTVPADFRQAVPHVWRMDPAEPGLLDVSYSNPGTGEGGTGLPYFDDPRSAVVQFPMLFSQFGPRFLPVKYGGVSGDSSLDVQTTLPVADGLEARLIEAEALLHKQDVTGWLAQLNALRAHASVPGAPAGTLPPLEDPGASRSGRAADSARVALTFAERAEWLYLTAHRQGDLRRLVRQYSALGFAAARVFPTGPYPAGGEYGTDVTYPIPGTEARNPLFRGCFTPRGA